MKDKLVILFLVLTLISCKEKEELNYPPNIEEIIVSDKTPPPEVEITLECKASDRNEDKLTYLWDSQAGEFISGRYGPKAVWKTPFRQNIYTITLTVSDGKVEANRSVNIEVKWEPKIEFYPQVINLSSENQIAYLTIWNGGTGELLYNISNSNTWVELNKKDGVVKNIPDSIIVSFYKKGMKEVNYISSKISISSTGGDADIEITGSLNPILSTLPSQLDFRKEIERAILYVRNEGDGVLSWEVQSYPDWIYLDIMKGTLTESEQKEINVYVNREGFENNNINTGAIKINSSVGQKDIIVKAQANPIPLFSKDTIDFGIKEDTFYLEIQNIGTGILEWSINENIDWLTPVLVYKPLKKNEKEKIMFLAVRDYLKDGWKVDSLQILTSGGDFNFQVRILIDHNTRIVPLQLDFGNSSDSLAIFLEHRKTRNMLWHIIKSDPFISVFPESGRITVDTIHQVDVKVDRYELSNGFHTSKLTFYGYKQIVEIPIKLFVEPSVRILSPDSVIIVCQPFNEQVILINKGGGIASYTAEVDVPWAVLDKTSNSFNKYDTLTVSAILTNAPSTVNTGKIKITDNNTDYVGEIPLMLYKPAGVHPNGGRWIAYSYNQQGFRTYLLSFEVRNYMLTYFYWRDPCSGRVFRRLDNERGVVGLNDNGSSFYFESAYLTCCGVFYEKNKAVGRATNCGKFALWYSQQ